jgi:hypothetical protein
MKTKLFDYIFENTHDLEEAMGISTGGASLASSGQISGGMQLPLGMKPGQKVKKRRKGKVISASPAVHNPDALALQEMPHVEYTDYEPKDFEIEKLDISPEQKRKLMLAFRGDGVLCHGPDGQWMVCTLDDVRKATKQEIDDESFPRLDVTLEYEHDIQESFGAMHKPDFKGPAMPGLWQGLEDPEEPVKTGSPELDKDIEDYSE